MATVLLLLVWCLFWPIGPLYGHGLSGEVTPGGLAVSWRYSTGEAMSFAKVTVTSPLDGRTFQVGNADRNGRFCFHPDVPGEWQVTADDGQGHRLTLTVSVSPEQLQVWQVQTPAPAPTSRLERALMGVSLIFGLAGVLFYWQARKKTRG